jgi:flagellar motility protein MotE (MotC chaperone)
MNFLKNVVRLAVLIFAAAFMVIAILVVVGWVSGTLSAERIDLAAKALRGELSSVRVGGSTGRDLTGRYEMEALKEAERAVKDLKRQQEILMLTVNERRSQLAGLETEAARIRQELADRAEAVAKAEKTFAEQKASYAEQLRSAGFRRTVETFQGMRKDQAARILYNWETETVVELLKAFDADFRVKVIMEMEKLDQLSDSWRKEEKAAKLLRLIYPGDPNERMK